MCIPTSRTYRGVFRRQCALRHVVLPESEPLRWAWRELVRSFLWNEKRFALLTGCYVAAQQREEFVAKHSLDPLKGLRRVPAIAFLLKTN